MPGSKNSNLYSQFEARFKLDSNKTALIEQDGSALSYAALISRSAQYANFLTGLGLIAGDRVSVQVEKSTEALCLYLGCLRAGLVFHPLNTGYQRSELEYFLGNAEPSAVVTDPRSLALFESIAGNLPNGRVLTLDRRGQGTICEQLSHVGTTFHTVTSDASDGAALLYSSGTTGQPKGILLSHGNLLSNAEALTKAWGFSSNDVLLHVLPIFHVHGLFIALGCVFLSGASMRWLPAFDTDQVIDLLPECSVLMGVPTYYTRLLANPNFGKQNAAGMRLFISGSAPLLAETFSAFERRTGHAILERYGMTETNINTSNPLSGARKPGTVGLPLPGVEVRVVDSAGIPVVAGATGFVEVRGPNVFAAYWRLPEKTHDEFRTDGFFKTGDNGQWDDSGYLAIVGRAKDMVITGGLNVYPKEIEMIIDDVQGVMESAVIGVPHADFGEAVVAVLVAETALDTNALRRFLKDRIAGFKVPKRIMLVDELPRNAMGKVQKNRLRDQYSRLFSD